MSVLSLRKYTYTIHCRSHMPQTDTARNEIIRLTKGISLVNCRVRQRRPKERVRTSEHTRNMRRDPAPSIVACQETSRYRDTVKRQRRARGVVRRNVGRVAASQRPSCANITRFPAVTEHAHIHVVLEVAGGGRRTKCTPGRTYVTL